MLQLCISGLRCLHAGGDIAATAHGIDAVTLPRPFVRNSCATAPYTHGHFGLAKAEGDDGRNFARPRGIFECFFLSMTEEYSLRL